MDEDDVFAREPPDLTQALKELRAREPIFHTPEFGRSRSELEQPLRPIIGRLAPPGAATAVRSFWIG